MILFPYYMEWGCRVHHPDLQQLASGEGENCPPPLSWSRWNFQTTSSDTKLRKAPSASPREVGIVW